MQLLMGAFMDHLENENTVPDVSTPQTKANNW